MAILPNVCLGRRSYAQNWEVGVTLKNCYGIEPPSYVSTAYVLASYGPRFLSTVRFVKIWATCENFVWQMDYPPPPPWQKNSRTPMLPRLSKIKSYQAVFTVKNKNSALPFITFTSKSTYQHCLISPVLINNVV